MTHADAVKLAAEWLKRPASRNGPACQVVVLAMAITAAIFMIRKFND